MLVLDTNVVSELMRADPDPRVVQWLGAQDDVATYTTSVTVAEISYGIARLPEAQRRRSLHSAAAQVFAEFSDRVLALDVPAALLYGDVVAARERSDAPISGFDAQIAAICRVHQAVLVTRNTDDFAGTGIDVVDPWSG